MPDTLPLLMTDPPKPTAPLWNTIHRRRVSVHYRTKARAEFARPQDDE